MKNAIKKIAAVAMAFVLFGAGTAFFGTDNTLSANAYSHDGGGRRRGVELDEKHQTVETAKDALDTLGKIGDSASPSKIPFSIYDSVVDAAKKLLDAFTKETDVYDNALKDSGAN